VHLYADNTGKLYKQVPGSSARTEVSLPTGVSQRSPFHRPDVAIFPALDCVVIVGQWTPNVIWFPSTKQLRMLGIAKPTTVPILTLGASTGITAECIVVYTFAEINDDSVVIHESSPSGPSATVSASNDSLDVSGMETSHANDRVNFKRLYISVDGDDFLWVANVPLATATATITSLGNLGEAVSDKRGIPPTDAIFVQNARGRAWYFSGDEKIWYSEIDEPESVYEFNYFKTLDRRLVTCAKVSTEQIIVGTRASVQEVQGWGLEDFNVRFITRAFGIVSHHGSKVLNDKLWAMTAEGYMLIAGNDYRFLMPTLRSYFRDQYLANKALYEDAVAEIDPYNHVLKILIPGDSAFYYVGHYLPLETGLGGNGTLPYWTFDQRARKDFSMGLVATGSLKDEMLTGSCDGYSRTENDPANDDDDGDSAGKPVTIAFRHEFAGDPGGDSQHTKQWTHVEAFVKSELDAYTMSLYPGDDDGYSAENPSFTKRIEASQLVKHGDTAIARTSTGPLEVSRTSGKGVTVEFTGTRLVAFECRGYELHFTDLGEQDRSKAG
jgi:hypothetical protein